MNIEIREINSDSFDEVRYFFITHEYCWKDSETYTSKSELKRDEVANKFMALLSNENKKYCCLGAFEGSRLIGSHFLDIYEIDNQKACHIHGLWIHEDFRHLGIAELLKRKGESWAKSHNCIFMDANVSVENIAMIKLNKKLDYEVARYNFRKKL